MENQLKMDNDAETAIGRAYIATDIVFRCF